MKPKPKDIRKTKPAKTVSGCFLKHAARETAWAARYAKDCDYISAHNALVRRGVWLTAALIVQEFGGHDAAAKNSPTSP